MGFIGCIIGIGALPRRNRHPIKALTVMHNCLPTTWRSLNRRAPTEMRQRRLLAACWGVLFVARAASADNSTNATQGHTGDSA